MVCSIHFVDGRPTLENPNPTLDLGYDKPAKRPRRELVRTIPEFPTATASKTTDAVTEPAADNFDVLPTSSKEASDFSSPGAFSKDECGKCIGMVSLAQELESIKKERDDLKDNVSKLSLIVYSFHDFSHCNSIA